MYAHSAQTESGFTLRTTLPCAGAAPRPERTLRKVIPLDPTAEAAMIKRDYEQSRLARIMAVRQASAAEAAQKRAAYQAAQAAKARAAREEAVALAAQQAELARQATEAQYARAQQEFGAAQRESAEFMARAHLAAGVAAERRLAQEAVTDQRFHAALTLVQHKNEAARQKRQRVTDLKQQIKQQQVANRAQLERQERAFAERTPAHIIEFNRATAPATPSPAAPTPRSNNGHLFTPIMQRTPGVSPRPYGARETLADEEDSVRPVPTPHPHPSARKPPATAPHTPAPSSSSVSVALDFTSPCGPRDTHGRSAAAPSEMSPAALKQRSADYRAHLEQQRASRASVAAVPRPRSAKAFELVLKQEGAIVHQRIVDEHPAQAAQDQTQPPTPSVEHAQARDPSTKMKGKTVRPSSTPRRRRTNFRARAVSTIPVLTPNLAFFVHSPHRDTPNEHLFHPKISAAANRAVAWVIPNEGDWLDGASEKKSNDEAAAPVALCGMQLTLAHEAQRATQQQQQRQDDEQLASAVASASSGDVTREASDAEGIQQQPDQQATQAPQEQQEPPRQQEHPQHPQHELIEASQEATEQAVGEVEPAQAPVPVEPHPSTPAHTTTPATALPFSSPLFPLATAAAARVASDQAFLSAAAVAASASVSSPSSAAVATPVAPRSSIKPPADPTLDQQLSHILQQHLRREEHLASPFAQTPQQLMVSPRVRSHATADESSEDEGDDAASVSSPAHLHQPLVSFSTPSIGGFASPGVFTPLTPAEALVARPTAATDLFIESIHYFIEQERAAAAQVDQEVVEAVVASTPAAKKNSSTTTITSAARVRHSQPLHQIDEGMPVPHASAFSSPTRHVIVPAAASPLVGGYLLATPVSSSALASPSRVAPPSDRKTLFHAFRALSDEEFQQAAPLQTPVRSATATPSRHNEDLMKFVTPQRNHAHRAQQQHRFEQRMEL